MKLSMSDPEAIGLIAAILGLLLTLGAVFVLSGCASPAVEIHYDGGWDAETVEEAPKRVREYYEKLSGGPVLGLSGHE